LVAGATPAGDLDVGADLAATKATGTTRLTIVIMDTAGPQITGT
jgi:hypothetical protein